MLQPYSSLLGIRKDKVCGRFKYWKRFLYWWTSETGLIITKSSSQSCIWFKDTMGPKWFLLFMLEKYSFIKRFPRPIVCPTWARYPFSQFYNANFELFKLDTVWFNKSTLPSLPRCWREASTYSDHPPGGPDPLCSLWVTLIAQCFVSPCQTANLSSTGNMTLSYYLWGLAIGGAAQAGISIEFWWRPAPGSASWPDRLHHGLNVIFHFNLSYSLFKQPEDAWQAPYFCRSYHHFGPVEFSAMAMAK